MGRREQNESLREFDELVELFGDPCFRALMRHVILRNRFTSGQRRHTKGELGEMEGTTGPVYGDPTGDEAVWDELRDETGKRIDRLYRVIRSAKADALWMKELSNVDVVKRAEQTIPDCLACGDKCYDGVRSGFDDKCRKRWDRMGRPDRAGFIYMVKQEVAARQAEEENPSESVPS